jgi:hypothetical protein
MPKERSGNGNHHCGLLQYPQGSTAIPRMLTRPAVDDSRPEIGFTHRCWFTPMIGYAGGMAFMDSGLTRTKVSA